MNKTGLFGFSAFLILLTIIRMNYKLPDTLMFEATLISMYLVFIDFTKFSKKVNDIANIMRGDERWTKKPLIISSITFKIILAIVGLVPILWVIVFRTEIFPVLIKDSSTMIDSMSLGSLAIVIFCMAAKQVLGKVMNSSEDPKDFTPREKEYFNLKLNGKTNKEIAEIMGIGTPRVMQYQNQVKAKVNSNV